MKSTVYSLLIILIISLMPTLTVHSADEMLLPQHECVKGDTVFMGDWSWYLKAPCEIPWDNTDPPIAQKTTDYYIDWSEPMRLTYFEGDDWQPKAVVQDSIIHLIWRHEGYEIEDIYYIRSTDWGESWSDTINLSLSGDTYVFGGYDIVVQYNNLIAFWTTSSGGRDLFYAVSENHGSTWQHMGRYDFNASGPILCKLANNSVLLSFYDSYSSDRRYDFTTDWGQNWLGSEHLSYNGPGGRLPRIVSNVNFIHFGFDNSNITQSTEIFYHHSSDYGQTWSIDNLITEDDGYPSQWPDNAVHDSVVHIAWFDMKYGGSEIITVRSPDNGLTWEDEYRLSYSHVAMDSRIVAGDVGTFVVWNDARHLDSSNVELYLRASFDDGQTWEPEERVTFAVGASAEPYLVLDGNTLYLFWIDTRDGLGYYEIYFKKGTINMTVVGNEYLNIPDKMSLSVSPNPFNSTTTIIYNRTLNTDREVIIEIYNLLGGLVKSLPIKKIKERSLQIIWDATDNSGNKVSSGIYFACIMEQHLITSIKVIYLR